MVLMMGFVHIRELLMCRVLLSLSIWFTVMWLQVRAFSSIAIAVLCLQCAFFYPPLSLTRPVLLYSSPFEWKWARVNNVRLPFSTIWTELISIHVTASWLFATAGTKRQRMRNKVNWGQSMTCTLRVTGATLIVACLVAIELQHFLISSRYFIVSSKLDSEQKF